MDNKLIVTTEEILNDFRQVRLQYHRKQMSLVIPQVGHVPCPKCSRNVSSIDRFAKRVKKSGIKKQVFIYIHTDNSACWLRKNEIPKSLN